MTPEAKVRERILDAAVGLFVERGLEQPTLEEIAARAGVEEEELRGRFESRDQIVAAAMRKIGTAFLDGIIENQDRPGDLAETVRRFESALGTGSYPVVSDRGVTPREVLAACARSPEVHRQYLDLVNECIARLERAGRAAQEGGRVRADIPPLNIGAVLAAALFGMQIHSELGIEVHPRRLAALLHRLLESPPQR